MNLKIIERFFNLKEKGTTSKKELDLLKDQIKKEMFLSGKSKEVYGDYTLELQQRDHGSYSNDIVDFLKENNLKDCVIETYDKQKLMSYISKGVINKKDIARFWVSKFIDYLYIRKNK